MIILVIDCQFLAYQALHTMKDLTADDVPTGVIFGFLSRVHSFAQFFSERNEVQVVFCWDSRSSVRKDLFPEYKLQRHADKTPEEEKIYAEFYRQCKVLRRQVLPKLGFKNIFIRKGFEADYLMARISIDNLDDVIIITADKDLWQMISVNTRIYNPSTHVMMNVKKFREVTSLKHPREWGWVKSVSGCRSDAVPPIVAGIGESTAIDYLTGKLKVNSARWKKVESRKTDPTVKANLARNKELVLLPNKGCSKPLVIRRDRFSVEGLQEVARKYQMHSLLKKSVLKEWKKVFR